ncbi:MAG: VTT domain-containing protein [Mangrovibacterium sp.]
MNEKAKFLLQNLAKALLYFLVLIGLYLLFEKYIVAPNKAAWKAYLYDRTPLVYLSYVCSEVFFGIVPPEIYMKWALHKLGVLTYWQDVTLFAVVSYGAGVLAFYAGRWLKHMRMFRFLSRKAFKELWPKFRKYGSALIIAAALTPLPWALVSMLVGTTEYSIKRYLLFALSRIFRFAAYGYLVQHFIEF